ncbi:MAG: hypothetical protein FWG65_03500 [Turicibacter sp.]|nr:hypothetical protein [Turicibacter sp.]
MCKKHCSPCLIAAIIFAVVALSITVIFVLKKMHILGLRYQTVAYEDWDDEDDEDEAMEDGVSYATDKDFEK